MYVVVYMYHVYGDLYACAVQRTVKRAANVWLFYNPFTMPKLSRPCDMEIIYNLSVKVAIRSTSFRRKIHNSIARYNYMQPFGMNLFC